MLIKLREINMNKVTEENNEIAEEHNETAEENIK